MSNKEIGKKKIEEYSFQLFLDSYNEITGSDLSIEGVPDEFPDFECINNSGSSIDAEITRVEDEQLLASISATDVYGRVNSELVAKIIINRIEEKAIRKPDLLLLELYHGPLCELATTLDTVFNPERFSKYKIDEIWITNYSEVNAFGDESLSGLFPDKWWGYHELDSRKFKKPFG